VCKYRLHWNAPAVAQLMKRKEIPNRKALALKLRQPRATVYRSFDQNWDGEVTVELLVALSRVFDVPIHQLVRDPRGKR
jgi:hypothetical protein